MTKMYVKDYVKLGAWTLAFIVGSPIWIPLAIIGYATDRVVDRMADKAWEYEHDTN